MAPKPAAADVHVKPTLQAVVLADSFATAFKPLTEKTPKALVPLGHVPMLEYTLEWLSSQGVEETYVLACAHAELPRPWFDEESVEVQHGPVDLGGGEDRDHPALRQFYLRRRRRAP